MIYPTPAQIVGAPTTEQAQFKKRLVIAPGGVAPTLTVAQSGALVLWDAAAGFTITLPVIAASDVGTWFDLFVTVTATSVNHKVITGAASSFLVGQVTQNTVAATPAANDGPKTFAFNGTTHVACTMNGTTTGGLQGTIIRVQALSATQWSIQGHVVASGIIATPAATS
jgi:hypothetical protein